MTQNYKNVLHVYVMVYRLSFVCLKGYYMAQIHNKKETENASIPCVFLRYQATMYHKCALECGCSCVQTSAVSRKWGRGVGAKVTASKANEKSFAKPCLLLVAMHAICSSRTLKSNVFFILAM